MPSFRAMVEGQGFLFMLDEESRYLDFHRTLCLEADSAESAAEQALIDIESELRERQIWPKEDVPRISLEHIEQIDVLEKCSGDQDFIWYFPEDALFEYDLRA